ncbi:MAG: Hsp20/alpha crystallin family protein [Candidatus Schekmanbacteria bacterium]|nr:Hsp20/alpha crystallin family protein [Candidatus Schekmanbacteria bacterium]
MSLVKWDPFRDLQTLQQRLNSMFGESFPTLDFEGPLTGAWSPAVDIHETKDAVVLTAELPGLSRDDLKINIEGRTLSISGEKKLDKETRRENYHRIERRYGSFTRSFTLPANVDTGAIAANLKDGMLTLRLPKVEAEQGKEIPILAD